MTSKAQGIRLNEVISQTGGRMGLEVVLVLWLARPLSRTAYHVGCIIGASVHTTSGAKLRSF